MNNDKNNTNYFLSFQLDVSGPRTIGIVQHHFERIWREISIIDATEECKQECFKKLREACSWMTRGVAEYHEVKEKK